MALGLAAVVVDWGGTWGLIRERGHTPFTRVKWLSQGAKWPQAPGTPWKGKHHYSSTPESPEHWKDSGDTCHMQCHQHSGEGSRKAASGNENNHKSQFFPQVPAPTAFL